jgi:hypothetical protein
MPPVPHFVDSIAGNRRAFERLRELLISGAAIAYVGVGALPTVRHDLRDG